MSVTRLFVEADLSEGAEIALSEAQAHHLRHVMRRAEGAPLLLFNGRDGEWRGSLGLSGKKAAHASVGARTREQTAEPDLWLCFAPIKRARIDLIAEKATELGVAVLQPVLTQHTAVERVNVERLQAHAIEAAEQTERLTVPQVRAPLDLMMIRDAAVTDIVPKMSDLQGYGNSSNPRLIYNLGHAVFEFIEAMGRS
mgnify:CR=1 FL=1